MGIEALEAELEAEGRERAEALRREAERDAVQVRADAEAALARRVAEALRGHEEELRRELGARLAGARREARARVLAERDAFLERVFAAAREALPRASRDPRAREVLAARLARALSRLPGAAVVRCAPALAREVRGALPEGADARVEADPELEAAAGFLARTEDGAVEVEATLPGLLELHRARLAIVALRELEADGQGAAGGAP